MVGDGELSGAAGVTPAAAREAVDFDFPSVEDAVQRHASDFGPFLIARTALEAENRWEDFRHAFAELMRRFNPASDGTARIHSGYFLVSVER